MELQKKTLTRRTFLAGSAVAAAGASLALAGCGGSGSSSGSASGAASGSGAAATGGTITAAPAYSSTNYNPIDLNGGSALMLAATLHVFEGLYDLDLRTYTTYNALAGGAPVKVSDTEYEVTLREAAKFSDGSDVTIEDVVNAFEKNMSSDTAGTIAPFLAFIDSVEKKDDTTVTIKLKYPFESLLEARLSLVKIFPAAKEKELATLPIGSGPWAYVEGALNGDDLGVIEFAPNPNYTGSKPALADSMVWNILKSDAIARVTGLTEGTVMASEAIPDGNVDQLLSAGASVEYVDGFGLPFFMFNTLKAPLNDKRVRQAFYYAIDMEKLINNQMAGHAKAARSFLNEGHPNFHEAANVFTYDPEKAKALLEEAGVGDINITLTVNNNWVQDLGPQIKNDLDAVGINTTLDTRALVWSEYAAPENGAVLDYDVVLTPGDPTCFGNDTDLLLSWWYADNIWTNGRTCWKLAEGSRFEELQELMQKARESADPAEQQDLWNQCFDLLSDEVPLYPLFHRALATGWRSDLLDGFTPIGTTGLCFLDASVKA